MEVFMKVRHYYFRKFGKERYGEGLYSDAEYARKYDHEAHDKGA
jgi:hypothetical protein